MSYVCVLHLCFMFVFYVYVLRCVLHFMFVFYVCVLSSCLTFVFSVCVLRLCFKFMFMFAFYIRVS